MNEINVSPHSMNRNEKNKKIAIRKSVFKRRSTESFFQFIQDKNQLFHIESLRDHDDLLLSY